MKRLPFLLVDAFTTRPYAGNACAVVFDAGDLSDAQMLAIAREMNQAETAFVREASGRSVALRFFTPAEEIPLAGHPTVASIWALLTTGRIGGEGVREFEVTLTAGPVLVSVEQSDDGSPLISMRQRPPEFLRRYTREEVAPAFGLDPADIRADAPVQTVSTGTPMLMVPLVDHAALRRAALDDSRYRALKAAGDFFSPHLFCLGGVTPAGDTFARQFGVFPDVAEDAATGSATGSMAAFLWCYGLISQPQFIAEQGHWMQRPSRIEVTIDGSREAIEAVTIAGNATMTAQGELIVP
jgi:trans-2,3-dihydro-3-hydroxyanthranilate isomerase